MEQRLRWLGFAKPLRTFAERRTRKLGEVRSQPQLRAHEKLSKEKYKTENAYLLFPNPAQNTVYITSAFTDNKAIVVKITDVNGKPLLEKQALITNYSVKLDLNLLNGIYFVQITTNEGKTENKKLVIAK